VGPHLGALAADLQDDSRFLVVLDQRVGDVEDGECVKPALARVAEAVVASGG
jgi:hypothetical protein